MDLLDRVRPAAADLLGRVDSALLTLGAPADHAVWTLLRTVGALPSEAVAHVAELSPGLLADAAATMRRSTSQWHDVVVTLPSSTGSEGVAAEAYANAWPGVAAHLADLAGRLDDAAAYLTATADWIARSRRSLAGTLAACLGSREALTLRSAGVAGVDRATVAAAADLATQVLAIVAHCLDDGWQLRDRFAHVLAESGPVDPGADPTIGPRHRIDIR